MARPERNPQPDKTQFVQETFESPLDLKRHDVPERHAFGEAFLAPNDADVTPTGPAPQTGSAGKSEKFARADHRHAFEGGGGSGGVTAHNQLTGLAVGDDHPQYTLTAEAEAIAAAAVNTHAAAADPHTGYLTQAEADALFLTPAEGNAAYDAIGAANAGDAAHVAAADPHTQYLRPEEILAGTNVVLDKVTTPGSVIIAATPGGTGITDHGLLDGLGDDDHPQYLTSARADALFLTPAEGNAAYVNVTGDTMTGPLTVQNSGVSYLTTNPAEPVKFGPQGHQHKWYAHVRINGATPVTSWTQMPLQAGNAGSKYNMTVQDSPGGILVPEAGFYAIHAMCVTDRALANLFMSIKFAGTNLVFGPWTDTVHCQSWRFSLDVSCIYLSSSQWITVNCQTTTPCWMGGDAFNESWIDMISLF